MDPRVFAMAFATLLAFFMGQRFEAFHTQKVKTEFAAYKAQQRSDMLAVAERLQGARDEKQKELNAAMSELAATRIRTSDYMQRFERLQREAATGSSSCQHKVLPGDSSGDTATASREELSGTLGAEAIKMIPEADEYLYRLRVCAAFAKSLEK